MVCNEDSDPDDHDDQNVHRVHPNSPSDASSLPTQLITLNQQGSLGDGGLTHYKVHWSLFHKKCHI
jgi:hypothetical protein